MGDAIADSFTLRIMLAARHADIPLVLGRGAIAAKATGPTGWCPPRPRTSRTTPASPTSRVPDSTGRCCTAGTSTAASGIEQAVADRSEAAGRPWFDRDTLQPPDCCTSWTAGVGGSDPGDRQIVVDAIEVMAEAGVERIRPEPLAEALPTFDPDAVRRPHGGRAAEGVEGRRGRRPGADRRHRRLHEPARLQARSLDRFDLKSDCSRKCSALLDRRSQPLDQVLGQLLAENPSTLRAAPRAAVTSNGAPASTRRAPHKPPQTDHTPEES
jgi:hypothetical protein